MSAREWITRPAGERAVLEAQGWRIHQETVRVRPGAKAEAVVIMCRRRSPDLFEGENDGDIAQEERRAEG